MEDIKLNSNEKIASDVYMTSHRLNMPARIEYMSMDTFKRDVHDYLEKISVYRRVEYMEPLEELIDAFVSNNIGADSDDFHNVAVDLARCSQEKLSVKVLKQGLKYYPRDVDLLADFLLYGKNCNEWEECKKCFDVLQSIPMHRWTWRGFGFSISYLISLAKQKNSLEEEKANDQLMMEIAENYKKFFPNDENSYISMSDVYKHHGKQEQSKSELKSALEKIKIAPRCAMRYAEKLFEEGEFAEALLIILRGIRNATQTQSGVNLGYMYFLAGLCKISYNCDLDKKMTKEEVLDVYCDFNIAARELTAKDYRNTIKSQVLALKDKRGIAPPKKYEELCDLLYQ